MTDNRAREFNFDGLVGPTHNYAGLSLGNVASLKNAQGQSSPKQAALEGLAKMKALHDAGFAQAVLPPLERPDVHVLRQLGFTGDDANVLQQAATQAPELLVATSSASSMWTANACTASPSSDCADGRLHITPANLSNKFHRSIEHPTTGRVLRAIFSSESHFAHHPALPSGDHFGDEGAANHNRFCTDYGTAGVEMFVFGKYAFAKGMPEPQHFPARQTYEASSAIARMHQLNPDKTVFIQQKPSTIDAGVFHNDVIAVTNGRVLFCHQEAFIEQQDAYEAIRQKFPELEVIEVPNSSISVSDAVNSYLFNSQLLSLPDGSMVLIAPAECDNNPAVKQYLDQLVTRGTSIAEVRYYDVQQSMKNGGGPACLRQRIVLNNTEQQAANQAVIMTETLYSDLCAWVSRHYRDSLSADDLADPQLLIESRTALDELSQLLKLGSVYPFQLV